MQSDGIGSEGAKALAKALSTNKSITTICVFEGEILDDGLEAIANVLSSNQTIKKLIVTCNKITDKGLQHLAKALEKNKTIIDINIAGNQISSEGVIALAPALKVNNTLQALFLHNNQICSKAMHALGEAIARNTGLKRIDLDKNIIDDEGLNSLAQGLKGNKSITNVTLSSNRITDKGVAHLVGAFGINTNINYLNIGNNSISEIGVNLLKPFFKSVDFCSSGHQTHLACHEQKPYQPPIEQPEEQPSDEAPQIPETSEISPIKLSVQVLSTSEITPQEQLLEGIVPSDCLQDNPATTGLEDIKDKEYKYAWGDCAIVSEHERIQLLPADLIDSSDVISEPLLSLKQKEDAPADKKGLEPSVELPITGASALPAAFTVSFKDMIMKAHDIAREIFEQELIISDLLARHYRYLEEIKHNEIEIGKASADIKSLISSQEFEDILPRKKHSKKQNNAISHHLEIAELNKKLEELDLTKQVLYGYRENYRKDLAKIFDKLDIYCLELYGTNYKLSQDIVIGEDSLGHAINGFIHSKLEKSRASIDESEIVSPANITEISVTESELLGVTPAGH